MTPKAQMFQDLLISAVESGVHGCGAWARFKNYNPNICHVFIRDRQEGSDKLVCIDWRTVSPPVIERGLKRIAEKKVKINNDYVATAHLLLVDPANADFDAPFADCVIQAGLFNDIIFG